MKITGYEALCNLGNNINEIYEKAIIGDFTHFDTLDGYIKNDYIRVGQIKTDLQKIKNPDFNIRCNQLILKNLELLEKEVSELIQKYTKDKIGIVVATTNSGVEEYEKSEKQKHFEIGNPAIFLKNHLELTSFCTSISTACSSGIKAFSISKDLLNNNICDAIIIACVDSLAKVPIYGFHSLEVLSNKPTIPFSKNRNGINIGEACSIFIVEKNAKNGIEIMGIGENSDIYHSTTPDPQATEAINAIKMALEKAKIQPEEIDYINAHGTGTIANDIMESTAINKIFKDKVPVSSTKPLTGHCLGAAAGIETALCCKLLDNFNGKLYPHIFDNEYDQSLQPIKLIKKNEIYNNCKICMCNSFGFGGSNTIMIIGKKDE